MITADSGSTNPSSSTGTRAARVQLVEPRGPVAQVDHDRLELEPLLGERDPHARAVRARRRVVQLHGSSPIIRAICSYSSAAGGSSAGRRRGAGDAPHLVAVGAGQPRDERRVRGERELVALRRARRSRSAPRGTRRPSGRARRAGSARRAACSSASATTTAPSRSDSSRAKRPCASRSRSSTGSAMRIQPFVGLRDVGRLEPRHELRERALDRTRVVGLHVRRRARLAGLRAPRAARSSASSGVAITARRPRSRAAARRRARLVRRAARRG